MKRKQKPRTERSKKKNSPLRRIGAWLHSVNARCLLVILAGAGLLMLLCCLVGVPEQYDLHVGSISRYTINATRDVVDEVSTQERRDAAASAVEPTYRSAEGANERVMSTLNAIFTELRTVHQYGLSLREEGETDEMAATHIYTEEQVTYARQMVTTLGSLSNYQVVTLMRTSPASFDAMVDSVRTVVENQLNTTIREGQVSTTITNMLQILGYRVDTSLFQNVVPAILRTCMEPNMVIDTETTEQARQAVMDEVEPVMYLQGQNIVREGERITARQMQMLRALGLLNDDEIDWTLYGGITLMAALIILVMAFMLQLLAPETLHDPKRLCVLQVVLVMVTGLGALCVKMVDPIAVPVAMAAIMLTGLLGTGEGVVGTVCMSMLAGLMTMAGSSAHAVEMIEIAVSGLIGGTVSVLFMRGKPQRVRALLCGVILGVLNLLVLTAVSVMTTSNPDYLGENVLYALGSGFVAGLLAVALNPLIEGLFNLATPSRLMELCNPNHPLLRRLLIEASGTYHHSIIVANLAESAAEKINANPLLARAGAYFHDIGKLKRPLYFKENQIGENPHDHTDPYVSAAILTAHTKDGLLLAQKHRLPKEIQTIIAEHHGDTPVMFFYHKAMQLSDGKPVDIADFRYDGKRPTLKEGAIIMLADTVEAAVRAMPDPTPQSILNKIETLVTGKLQDGQLTNCPLTLKEIDGIIEAFAAVMNGVFHERIEYPEMNLPKRSLAERTEVKAETVKTEPAAKPKAECKAKAECQPKADTEADGKSAAEPAVKPAAEPEAKPAANPATEAEAKPAVKPAAEPEAKAAARPETEPEAKPAVKPAAEPEAKPAVKPAAEPETKPAVQPAGDKAEAAVKPAAPAAQVTEKEDSHAAAVAD